MALLHHRKWKKGKEYSPFSLMLDPQNYRLDQKPGLSQAEIIAQLVAKENVRELASLIVNKGYAPVEDLVIIEEEGARIVVEGNRRLCSYQLLAKPALAPGSDRPYFEKLKARAGDELPKRIHCTIAPNRSEAQVFVYSKHTDEGFSKRWQSVRQAAFVVDQLSKGLSLDELVAQTGLSRGKIIERVTGLDLYRLAATTDLSDRAKSVLTDPNRFPWTALVERIFGHQEIRKLLGVRLTERGIEGTAGTREEFLGALKPIFEDVADGEEAATRKYGTADAALDRFKSKSHDYAATGAASWKVFRPGAEPSAPAVGVRGISHKQKATRRGSQSPAVDTLLPRDLNVEIGSAKLKELVDEAQRLDLSQYFHSGAVLLRCILELALNEAIKERKCKHLIVQKHRKRCSSGEVPVFLILKEMQKDGLLQSWLEPDEARGLRHLIAEGPLSYDVFHLYVHNRHWPATYDAVKASRENLLPILRKSVQKPNPTP